MDVYCMPMEPGAFDRAYTDPRRASSYGARWTTVVNDLADEAEKLGGDEVVIALDLERSQLRLDGYPKAAVKVPDQVAIYLPDTDHGPLRFLSDRWWGWRDNVRAVGLTLQRLRLVAEAGVAQSGEQYQGWQALPPGRPGLNMSAEEARAILRPYGEPDTGESWATLARRALKIAHPDHGGDAEQLARVIAARETLGL